MALQNLVGEGIWIPNRMDVGPGTIANAVGTAALLDADEEEYQAIGRVHIDGGGSKTFGTSGSSIAWLPGTPITFGATCTLRVGVKKASSVDTANGPPARATIGAAAFDVYKDLVGGTDTITASTFRTDAMATGTGFTVTHGDLIAVCWHLDITANAQSVRITNGGVPGTRFPSTTLVTSGPTYSAAQALANAILKFDDGTLGWITPGLIFSVAGGDVVSASIGNTNIYGNIFQVPYSCKIDALAALVVPSTNAADFALELYSTPLGTPTLVESVAIDPNTMGAITGIPFIEVPLTTPRTLTINTDYCIGIKQTTATSITTYQRDVDVAAHFKVYGMGAECYAATSTAGATFAAANSGKRRYTVFARISALDDGVGGGGGMMFIPNLEGT